MQTFDLTFSYMASTVGPLLVESSVVIFYVTFLMCFAVIFNYFGKKKKSVFTTVASRLKSKQEKKNLETKYNMI